MLIIQILYTIQMLVFGNLEIIPLPRNRQRDPTKKDFTCFDGSLTMPLSYVNDDYCDCSDGSDEPGTSACPNGIFFCENKGHISHHIPSSRVNDGYCDCCDASDEYLTMKCTNKCDVVGSIWKERRKKTDHVFTHGNQIRLQLAAAGKRIREERQLVMVQLENKMMEYEKILYEKEFMKNLTERRKLEVLKSKGALKSLKEKRKEEEMKAGSNIFSIVDVNSDGRLQLDEIRKKPIFDEDKDGVVSDEELEYFTELNTDISKLMFFNIVWPKLKHLYLFDKLDAIPHEHSDYEIIWQADIEKPENTEHLDWSKSHTVPLYDENTKQVIERANQARSEYKAAQASLEDIEQELASIKQALSVDYGSENEYVLLEGHCFNYSDMSFYYKICPFNKVVQATKMDGPETTLGSWAGWLDEEYKTMFYDRGEICWKDHRRTVKVDISCGLTNEVIQVLEPTRCEYIFEFSSPAACKVLDTGSHMHDEL